MSRGALPWLRPAGARAAPPAVLPAAVQASLEREQFRSELLVSGVQLLLVSVLAVLVALTPEGYAPGAPVEAAPLGLVFFTLVVLLRLHAARTGQLTPPVMFAAVVAEMLVLLFVIWAYHLQYEQPPQFALKSTEFVFVFALVALRALRFEPAWVLVSGLTAALGWVVLIVLAVSRAPDNPVTWDYVTSLRSFQVHYGAEFDKVLAVLVVTAVLALAIARARALLERAVTQQRAATELARFFDDGVAQRIVASDAGVMAGQGDVRDAAILFLDLRGFTEASMRLSPADLIALLGEYQRLAVPLVRRHGGSIDKFLGDGILASFGAVMPDERAAAHALRAVDDVMAAVDAWRSQRTAAGQVAPDVGAALATGPVLFGVLGDGTRLEYTVIGDAVNLAAKLEKHNKRERTRAVTTRAAYELARRQGYEGEKTVRASREVAGVAVPIDLAVLA